MANHGMVVSQLLIECKKRAVNRNLADTGNPSSVMTCANTKQLLKIAPTSNTVRNTVPEVVNVLRIADGTQQQL
jgi:hypothetical protein